MERYSDVDFDIYDRSTYIWLLEMHYSAPKYFRCYDYVGLSKTCY